MKILKRISTLVEGLNPLLLIGMALTVGAAIDLATELAWHDQQRIEQIVLLLMATLTFAITYRKIFLIQLASLPNISRRALGLGFALGGLSAGLSAYPRFASLEWATLLLLLGLALLTATQARQLTSSFDIWATRLIVALAVIILLKIMTGYLAAVVVMKHIDSVMLFEGTFSNRRFFGQVASMLVPLLSYPLLRGGLSKPAQAALFALLAAWWMLVIVSGTRGTWMALTVAAVMLVAVSWRASMGLLRVQASALGMGALLFVVMFVWLPFWLGQDATLENRLSNFSALNGRAELWALAWAQIQAHPWLGVGPMHLAAIRNNFGAHPHNAVLQLVAEWGIPAALALILSAAAGMLSLLARLRQQAASPDLLLLCLTASLLAAGAQSMVDGVIVIPYTQTLLVLVAGWALGAYFRGVFAAPAASISRTMCWVISGVSILALIALLNGVFPEALNRVEVTQAYADAGKLIPPRYWGVGWIP